MHVKHNLTLRIPIFLFKYYLAGKNVQGTGIFNFRRITLATN
jgi:hypothetical protein